MSFSFRLFGACFGVGCYLLYRKPNVLALCPTSTWDTNWDHRELRPATRLPTVRRHLILIRHGQCDYRNPIDAERELTSLGRIQAKMTALRLAALKLPIDKWVFSTMQRAQETGNILLSQQRTRTMCKVEDCPLIVEGIPCEPSPYEYWNEDEYKIWQDQPRLEAAFRKHFHRADSDADADTYTVLVCHANIIRYFICRALQLPSEAWLRFTLHHGSITGFTIEPSGEVTLRMTGEISHMPPHWISLMNAR